MSYFLRQIYSRIAATLVVLFDAGTKNADDILRINSKRRGPPARGLSQIAFMPAELAT